MVWGGWGDAEKSYASMCVEFLLFAREESQENHPNHFSSLTLVLRHRFFFFVPENLHPVLLGKSKKTRARK